MPSQLRLLLAGPLAFALAAACGCGSAPDLEVAETADTVAGDVVENIEDEVVAEDAEDTGDEATSESTDEAETETPAPPSAEYAPPFPDRIDLFVIPKRQGAPSKSQHDDVVELIGFARLDKVKALLSFNGEVSPLAEGSALYGVEVISIQPPKVVLQRGRQRWQASLNN